MTQFAYVANWIIAINIVLFQVINEQFIIKQFSWSSEVKRVCIFEITPFSHILYSDSKNRIFCFL